jgi:phosphoheptose isomerase
MRRVRLDRIAQLLDAGSAKLLFPETLTMEEAREILLAALSNPRTTEIAQRLGSQTLIAVFGENLYMIVLGNGTSRDSSEHMLYELKHLVDRLQKERTGS